MMVYPGTKIGSSAKSLIQQVFCEHTAPERLQ